LLGQRRRLGRALDGGELTFPGLGAYLAQVTALRAARAPRGVGSLCQVRQLTPSFQLVLRIGIAPAMEAVCQKDETHYGSAKVEITDVERPGPEDHQCPARAASARSRGRVRHGTQRAASPAQGA